MTEWIVHLADEADEFGWIKGAQALGTAYGGRCEAFVTAIEPMSPYGLGSELLAEPTRDAIGAELGRAERLREQCQAATNIATRVLMTSADRLIVDSASAMRTADLVVCAAPRRNRAYVDDDIFEAALFVSGRPVLVLPPDYRAGGLMGKVVIAWKDCRESARATFDALPLLTRASEVSIVAVSDFYDEPSPPQEAMAAALRRRGVNVVSNGRIRGDGRAGEALAHAASAADLLVMGGYGHWRLSQLLFGGVTRFMLASAPLPLFMAH